MNLIIYLIVGALVGAIASRIMHSSHGIFIDIVIGIVGAFLAGYLISPLLGVGTINDGLSIASFLVSVLGAVILLAIVKLFTGRRV